MAMKLLSALLLASVLAACAGHDVAACHGPIEPLNVGQWTPTPQDLAP